MKNQKFLFMTLLLCCAFLSCSKDDDPVQTTIAVTAVTISEGDTYAMTVGDSHTFRATVSPSDATDKSITWSSSASTVLSIDAQSGEAEALADGRATVTAQAGEVTATIEVTIAAAIIAVESVTISPATVEALLPEEQVQLTATVAPDNATDKSVVWESLHPAIATVDQTGLVTAVAEGEATIRATAGEAMATIEVTIAAATIAVESVTISPATVEALLPEEQVQLTATVAPDNATDKSVVWESLHPAIATVDQTGLVTAIAEGEATIRAAAGEVSDEIVITVEQPSIPVVTVPQGWTVNGNTATYGTTDSTGYKLSVTFENEVCKTAEFTTLTRESREADIEAVFPESVIEAFTITNRGTVATIDLLVVNGCKKFFHNLSMAEMFEAVGDNTSAILDNWTETLTLCNTINSSEVWSLSSFDCFGTMRNQQHIDYLLFEMNLPGKAEDPQLAPEACQLELIFNTVTGLCETVYVYMEFTNPTSCQMFTENIKRGVEYTRDVGGGQGESVQITLHTISDNEFTGKTRTEIIEMSERNIILNTLSLITQ